MFQGFTDETFEFFMAIRFNNNADFFHANHDWYVRAVREPCLALADALNPVIEAMDESLERRPARVVSRINRDVRFSRDKSPYRDYLWLAFRRPGEARHSTLGVYCDISADGGSYGMGFYDENRPLMNGLRRALQQSPEDFLRCWRPVRDEFSFEPRTFKRMKPPEGLHPEAAPWYPMRSFYIYRNLRDFSLLKSPALVDEIASGFQRLTPLYRFITAIPCEKDPDETRENPNLAWKDFAF